MKITLIKYLFIGIASIFYFGCTNLSNNPTGTTSSNEKIEVYNPASGDTIGYGQTEIIYDLINPSGIKFIELYVNDQFVRNYPPQNGNRPLIQLNIDSSMINQKISYYLIYYNLNNGSVKSKVMSNIFIGEPRIPPFAPYNINVVHLSSDGYNISWKDSSSVVEGYEVWRKIGLYGSFTLLKKISQGTFNINDVNVNTDTIYFYKVRGFNKYGNSGFSQVVNSAGIGGTGNMLPPTNLTSVPLSNNRIYLSWEDNSSNENYFKVERGFSKEILNPIAYLTPNSTQFTDSVGIYSGSEFYYRIKAFSDSDSSWSNIVYIKVP